MELNWNAIGHAAVGAIIGGAQAIALADSANAQVVLYCHIISIIVAQLGSSLGVWQVSQSLGVRSQLKLLQGGMKMTPPEAKAA
jgi:hypothetical protein